MVVPTAMPADEEFGERAPLIADRRVDADTSRAKGRTTAIAATLLGAGAVALGAGGWWRRSGRCRRRIYGKAGGCRRR